jgi:hypothetical protein
MPPESFRQHRAFSILSFTLRPGTQEWSQRMNKWMKAGIKGVKAEMIRCRIEKSVKA